MAEGRFVPFWALADYLFNGQNEPRDIDGVVRQAVYKARKALPEGAIQRVRGLGYRLTIEVELPAVDMRTTEELMNA